MPQDPIRHVVVLMLENRSFDHMLGGLQKELGLNGVDPSAPRSNAAAGVSYPQAASASRRVRPDPMHETPNVLAQLEGKNGGFVEDFRRAYPASTQAQRAEVMKYHAPGALPALHQLARSFTVCDRWFSSVPGPTWANRFFLHSGTAKGRVKMPTGIFQLNWHWYDQDTLYDRLNERGRSWRVYFGDIPQSLVLTHQLQPKNARRYAPMQRFYEDASGPEEAFPEFAFIEPEYFFPSQNDDHPPHDVLEGQRLIARVYNVLQANQDLWSKTLLVLLWDEHGGFYDHEEPPGATPPDPHREEYTFDRLGVRVPAVLVSPYASKAVCSETFDHTSLLRYLSDKWSLGPLGERVAKAKSFAPLLLAQARETPGPLSVPSPPAEEAPFVLDTHSPEAINGNQQALIAFSQYLETLAEEPPERIAVRARESLGSPQAQIDVAIERVERFLEAQSRKAG